MNNANVLIDLNKDLSIAPFASKNVGEVRIFHPIPLDASSTPTDAAPAQTDAAPAQTDAAPAQTDAAPAQSGELLLKGLAEWPSMKIRRKLEERHVAAIPTANPVLSDELRIVGALEQRVQFDADTNEDIARGRSLIASCFGQSYVSITIRKENSEAGIMAFKPCYDQTYENWTKIAESPKRASVKFNGKSITRNVVAKFAPKADRGDYLCSFHDQCDDLFDKLPTRSTSKTNSKSLAPSPSRTPLPGLIVIAGGTGSGKSEIARGLIHKFLIELSKQSDGQKTSQKRPHLLTVENPIEKYLFTYESASADIDTWDAGEKPVPPAAGDYIPPEQIQEYFGIDYTPRQMPDDTPSLEQALMHDALRQTPDLVYVGEIREPGEFKTVLDFAETGHAVITTMHAGSLREAMQRILTGAKAHTPAERGAIASRINAIIHLEKMVSKYDAREVTLPTIWLRNNSAIANLVADGLSSLSPSRTENRGEGLSMYCFGRTYFLELATKKDRSIDKTHEDYSPLLQEAISRDMNITFVGTEKK